MSSSASVYTKSFSALLFDMDGTILNSIPVVERIWGDWAARHGLDATTFMPTMHGIRAVDTIRRLDLPGVDAEYEAAQMDVEELAHVDGILAIPGAIAFLKSLPADRWAIVTSATRVLAEKRLTAAGLPYPKVLVGAEDVSAGKPGPECYLLGAERLGFKAADCLVLEDAPAGILAGEAAGASVLVITETHSHAVETSRETIVNYEGLRAVINADGSISLVRDA